MPLGVHRWKRGSGGLFPLRDGVWRVDAEVSRDPATGLRRRVSRTVAGTRRDAEMTPARLRAADHEKPLPAGGTNARSVRSAFQLYQQAVGAGLIELAPRTGVTVRSAASTMSSTRLADGRALGDLRLCRLTWQDVEALYAAMRAAGHDVPWIRRCATVLNRALELALERGRRDANRSEDAARPRSTRTEPFAPSGSEVVELLDRVRRVDSVPSDAITVQASTGMRVGELLGLCWGDVDPAGGETHAAWALTDGGPGLGVVRKATKRSDWQDVHLTDSAVSALRAHWLRPCDLAGAAPTSESALLRLFRRRRRHDPKAARAAAQPPGGSPRSFAGHPRSLPALRGHHHARRDEASRIAPSGTSWATASPPCGSTTTDAPMSANARRSPPSNSDQPNDGMTHHESEVILW